MFRLTHISIRVRKSALAQSYINICVMPITTCKYVCTQNTIHNFPLSIDGKIIAYMYYRNHDVVFVAAIFISYLKGMRSQFHCVTVAIASYNE